MQTTRRQSLIVNLLVGVSVTILFLGALEGLARLFEQRPATRPAATERRTWQASWRDDFYTVLTPGHGWPFDGEFNRDGLRAVTHPLGKAPRTLRLVFLGDSVTAGVDLAPHEAFPRVLGELLDEAGRDTEVFNVALSGWSTRQERIAYERLVRRYRPDRVVVAVCLNDIDEPQNNLARPPRWLAVLHERSALVRRLVNARQREIESTAHLFSRADSPEVRDGDTSLFEIARRFEYDWDDVARLGRGLVEKGLFTERE